MHSHRHICATDHGISPASSSNLIDSFRRLDCRIDTTATNTSYPKPNPKPMKASTLQLYPGAASSGLAADLLERLRITYTLAGQSGRGLPHSKTWRRFFASRNARQRLGVRQSPAAFCPARNELLIARHPTRVTSQNAPSYGLPPL